MENDAIRFADFQKLDLRVARIIAAERIEGSDKLLKLRVDLGSGDATARRYDKSGKDLSGEPGATRGGEGGADDRREDRQIVAGIGKVYDPERLIGRLIIVVANLEARMLMGFESQGMLLAADAPEGPALLGTEPSVLPGAAIR